MKSLVSVIKILFITALFCSGCSSPETAPEATTAGAGSIVCEVFYRSSDGGGVDTQPLLTFSEGNDLKVFEFETMTIAASFQDDAYEGRSLSIAVTNLENGSEIFRQLYQFDPKNPVENQFVGGHGFTGLNYIFHPDSSAEIQYFCSLK